MAEIGWLLTKMVFVLVSVSSQLDIISKPFLKLNGTI